MPSPSPKSPAPSSLPVRRQSYSESTKFMVFVLWLYGSTLTSIAKRVGLRRKQVAGIVARSDYTNRSAMTIDARQRFLNELAHIRAGDDGKTIDGGRLPAEVFRARAIQGER